MSSSVRGMSAMSGDPLINVGNGIHTPCVYKFMCTTIVECHSSVL